jgi:hypothetical protein
LTASRLEERRAAAGGLSYNKVAALMSSYLGGKYSQQTVKSHMGGRTDAGSEDLAAYAKVFRTTVAYLTGEIDDPSPDAIRRREFRGSTSQMLPRKEFEKLYEELESLRRRRELLELEEREREIRRLLEGAENAGGDVEPEGD